jgi:hypothetical protein
MTYSENEFQGINQSLHHYCLTAVLQLQLKCIGSLQDSNKSIQLLCQTNKLKDYRKDDPLISRDTFEINEVASKWDPSGIFCLLPLIKSSAMANASSGST